MLNVFICLIVLIRILNNTKMIITYCAPKMFCDSRKQRRYRLNRFSIKKGIVPENLPTHGNIICMVTQHVADHFDHLENRS